MYTTHLLLVGRPSRCHKCFVAPVQVCIRISTDFTPLIHWLLCCVCFLRLENMQNQSETSGFLAVLMDCQPALVDYLAGTKITTDLDAASASWGPSCSCSRKQWKKGECCKCTGCTVQCMIAIVICKLALTQMAAKAVPMLQAAMDCITHGQAFEFWVVSNMTVCLASEPAG